MTRWTMTAHRKLALAWLAKHGPAFVSMLPVSASVIRGLAKMGLVEHRAPSRVGRNSSAQITASGRNVVAASGASCTCFRCSKAAS